VKKHYVHCTQHVEDKTQTPSLNLAYSTVDTSALLRL